MKKKVIFICIILSIIIVLIFLFIYNNKRFKKSNLLIEDSEIKISVLENTITNEGLSFILINNSNQVVNFTEDIFSLEFQKNGIWYKQPTLVTEFSSLATRQEVGISEEITIDINWMQFYGQIGGGKYRLVVPVNDGEKSIFIATEFIIKEEKE